ncbi:hypothetical protein L596_021824 [Steinernema carpocapsae]|uniref:Uncharacterized protein n=1 Tax=Steinernema carpocapsae TaxID=34508 RepID=A0A4U5MKQ6_STECR|nr:hypothetical protein L596_021824 [Steinernema carpocapsae]
MARLIFILLVSFVLLATANPVPKPDNVIIIGCKKCTTAYQCGMPTSNNIAGCAWDSEYGRKCCVWMRREA